MYKYAVFDLDGTLANTLEDLANAVNYSLEKNGFPPQPLESYKQMVGSGRINLIKLASGSNDEKIIADIKNGFDEYYSNHTTDCTTEYPDGSKMLEALQKNGVVLGVLSNKPNDFVKDILDTLFPNVKFSVAWGKKEGFPIKPDPASFNALINELGADKKDVVYVGDSNVDVYTAQNTGVDFIGCAWGFRGADELSESGADKIAENNQQLLDMILGNE